MNVKTLFSIFGVPNLLFGRASFSGMLKVVMSETPFRDQPYLIFIFLNFIFSLGRLSSDELSLNLDVLLGRMGPPGIMWRNPSFSIICLILFLIDLNGFRLPLAVNFLRYAHTRPPAHTLQRCLLCRQTLETPSCRSYLSGHPTAPHITSHPTPPKGRTTRRTTDGQRTDDDDDGTDYGTDGRTQLQIRH